MSRQLVTNGPTFGPPRWAGGPISSHLMPGGAKVDATQFHKVTAVKVVVGAAGAAQNAVAVPVAALAAAIPNGTVLDFGTNKFARLTAAAALGAVSLTVAAIPTALVSTDTAWYEGLGRRTIKSGTVIGRTFTERDAGTAYGPAINTDDEVRIVAFDITDADAIDDVELYRPQSIVKENFLPEVLAGTLLANVLTVVRATYQCTIGQV